ncbi:MAG: methyltransferase domain-containing protein [Alphaproteobacteria bacterium]|nr:MAG: methyltransferase domain-containing protein [Alphaproteobacteria bacterium]
MAIHDFPARKSAWSAYWAAGSLNSCAGSFTGNYTGVISDFWRRAFASLPPQGRVLDIATGNGALPLMMSEHMGNGTGLQIDAVDMAMIAPQWHDPAAQPGIRFHAGVRMEALPFRDAIFDAVTSQYGLEYGNWPDALLEASRVCDPQGGLALVLHHPESVLVQVGRIEIANHRFLSARYGLLEAARSVLPWMAAVRSGSMDPMEAPAAQASKSAYNLAILRLGEEILVNKAPDLLVEARERVHRLVSGAGPEDALVQLNSYVAALDAAALRTAEMIDHAVDHARLDELHNVLSSTKPGWTVDVRPLAQAEGILGWAVLASSGGRSA